MSDCIGHTKKGAPCKKRKAIGSDYCGVHEDMRRQEQRESDVHKFHALERAITNHGFRGIDNTSQVKLLLDNRADANAKLPSGTLPIKMALERGGNDVSILKLLLNANADPNHVFVDAVKDGFTNAVTLLIKSKADVNLNNPLYEAIDFGNNVIIEKLLCAKADPNQLDRHRESYIFKSIIRGNTQAIDLLLEAKADPNAGMSLLELLLNPALAGRAFQTQPNLFGLIDERDKLIKKLVKAKADPNRIGLHEVSPLTLCLSRSVSLDVVKCLLEAGADPNYLSRIRNSNIKDVPSLGAIIVSSQYQNNPIEYAQLLVRYGANPKITVGGLDLFTILTKLSLYNMVSDPDRFRELLQYYVDIRCPVQLDRQQLELPNNFLEIMYEILERSRGEAFMHGIINKLKTGPRVNDQTPMHPNYTKHALIATQKLAQSKYTRKDRKKKDDSSSSSSK